MTRREPFYKKWHNAWYVHFEGKYVRLLAGKNDAITKDEANNIFEEMKFANRKAARFISSCEQIPIALGDLIDKFLASAFKGKSVQTQQWYSDKLPPFVNHYGREFTTADLKPFHVDEWAAVHPNWSAGTVRNLWRAVQRLSRWGHHSGLIPEPSILYQEKPMAGLREVVISPEQYKQLLTFVRNDEFRTLVMLAWETGARPQELLAAAGLGLTPVDAGFAIFASGNSRNF